MPRSPARRRNTPRPATDLFAGVDAVEVIPPLRDSPGNYATRTVRKWIRGDPAAVDACRRLAADIPPVSAKSAKAREAEETLFILGLARQLAAWFSLEVRTDEPSAVYADYLCGSIDVEWETLAEEFLAEVAAD